MTEVSGKKCSSSTHDDNRENGFNDSSFISPLGQAYISLKLLWFHSISTWVYTYSSHFSVFVLHLLRNVGQHM